MADLQIEIEQSPGAVIVRLAGDGGVGGADRLQSSLMRLTALRPTFIVFDMAGLVFVASIFMGALVGFRRSVSRNGGQVHLACMQPNVEEAFRAAHLNELFSIAPTVDEALAQTIK